MVKYAALIQIKNKNYQHPSAAGSSLRRNRSRMDVDPLKIVKGVKIVKASSFRNFSHILGLDVCLTDGSRPLLFN